MTQDLLAPVSVSGSAWYEPITLGNAVIQDHPAAFPWRQRLRVFVSYDSAHIDTPERPQVPTDEDLERGYDQLLAIRAAGEDPDHHIRPRRRASSWDE